MNLKTNSIVNLLDKRLCSRQEARSNFKDFILYVKNDYQVADFHNNLIKNIEHFNNSGSDSKQMIFVPPQHGKSELSSRLYPAFVLGKNPSAKIALLSYSKTIAEGFSNDVQKFIASEAYRELFPNTIIDGVGCKRGTYKRNSFEVHTSEGGYLISVGVGGPLTSKTVDIAIIDDLYKNHMEAWSATHRQKVEQWYWSVLETRLHNSSKILLLYTRWHELDLAGSLLKSEPELWKKTVYEMLKTKDCVNKDDHREIGEALWPEKHSKKKALRWKERDPASFAALGQQRPRPLKGLMYSNGFKVYNKEKLKQLEQLGVPVKSYTDTADTGSDYLATYIFYEWEDQAYIKDIIYTQDDMTITIPLWARKHYENSVNESKIEYNNGGHPFKIAAEDKLKKELKYSMCHIHGFHQTENKQARILTRSAWVQDNVFFPENWHIMWNELYESLTNYVKEGKNLHDDAEDALTGVAEMVAKDDEFWYV